MKRWDRWSGEWRESGTWRVEGDEEASGRESGRWRGNGEREWEMKRRKGERVRECEWNKEKNDMEYCESSKSDVAVFGGR